MITMCNTWRNNEMLCSLPALCIYVFSKILGIKSDYFLIQDWVTGLCKGDTMHFLWCVTKLLPFIYMKFWLPKVKSIFYYIHYQPISDDEAGTAELIF
jgi:hypothetical protein